VSDRVAGIRPRYRTVDRAGSPAVAHDDSSVRLRAAGLTVTAARMTVLRGLAGRDGSYSAASLYDLLREEGSTLGLTNLHRVLRAFSGAGLVHVFAGREQRFRLCGPDPHAHLVCDVCGRVIEVPLEVAQAWLEPARHTVGFFVDAGRCNLYGQCEGCWRHERGEHSGSHDTASSGQTDVMSR
jgi:Fur family ferric uptake transcriptional regulator